MRTITIPQESYDFVVIGSGFGGSVSALRLSKKGYRVLVIEKGKKYSPEDFPETNWKLSKWLWLPSLGFFGFFKMTFLRHIGILSGVGVGGGSLVYANTLPRPPAEFFSSGNWAGLADWEAELEPFYRLSEEMLGAAPNPRFFDSDIALRELAVKLGKGDSFKPVMAAVYFGEPEVKVPDPYFAGRGPDREGCSFCGGCMTGCRHNAKNTLDKNYLYLAAENGADVLPEHSVKYVRTIDGQSRGGSGYEIGFTGSTSFLFRKSKKVTAKGVVFAGGVLGTVRLLLDMRKSCLPLLSKELGNNIRTNNESLVLVDSRDYSKDFSRGIAIGGIFPPDENSHLEPVRYGSGSGFWKLLGVPLTHGSNIFTRIGKLVVHLFIHPLSWFHIYFTKDHAKQSVILLFMQHINSTLRFKRGLWNLKSGISSGKAPTAFIPESKKLADGVSEIIKGKPFVLVTEAVTGIPTTAHILGGAVIGRNIDEGVIDTDHKVFGYENMFVCDGSAISANPGVNPALTIAAMTERAMDRIPTCKQ